MPNTYVLIQKQSVSLEVDEQEEIDNPLFTITMGVNKPYVQMEMNDLSPFWNC